MSWAGLGWVGLSCVKLGCVGLDWAGLNWVGFGVAVRKALTQVQLSVPVHLAGKSPRRIPLPFNKYETDRLTPLLKWKAFFTLS